jgi:protein gp37
MAENTGIEWADHTFNPWIGCTKVGPGCDHCYAEARMDTRLHRVQWGAGQPRQRTKTWGDPLRWNKQHEAFFAEHGRRQRVFCASLADVFDNEAPPAWRAELFALIACTPHLDWLLLTKRIGNVRAMIEAPGMQKDGLPPNVWLGATVVNQIEADRDVPKLLAVPVRVRFLSIEPMLGPIDLTGEWLTAKLGAYPFKMLPPEHRTKLVDLLDWVIVGGESGPGARPMHPDWARSLRDQCEAAGVPFLFKQWGEFFPDPDDDRGVRPIGLTRAGKLLTDNTAFNAHAGDAELMFRVGKKAAGRQLDGRTHDEFPKAGNA